MFRFKSISVFGSDSKDFRSDITQSIDGSYIVDDSHFAPMSETVKRLQSSGGQVYSSDEQSLYFDFPNGKKPDGYKVPFVRGPDYKDIAELSQYVLKAQKDATASLSDDIEIAKDKAMLQNIAKRASSASSDTKGE